mgnify:CR=1 FL=1
MRQRLDPVPCIEALPPTLTELSLAWSRAVEDKALVALATIEDMLLQAEEAPWYRVAPQLPVTLANLMDRVNREQYIRFAGELEARLKRHRNLASDGIVIVREIVRGGARRVGVHPSHETFGRD